MAGQFGQNQVVECGERPMRDPRSVGGRSADTTRAAVVHKKTWNLVPENHLRGRSARDISTRFCKLGSVR